MAFLLKRNASVLCSSVESGFTTSNTVRLNLVDETFSYSQSSAIQDSSRDQVGPSGRGAQYYTSMLNPANFSFSTYLSSSSGIIPDEILWEAFTNSAITGLGTIDFASSDVSQLPEIFFWFDHQGTTYKLSSAVLETASISMNLEGIPVVTWSGKAKSLASGTAPTVFTDHKGAIPEVLGKLTTIAFTRNADSKVYTLALTDLTMELNNSVTWVGRNRLGSITKAETHYIGDRVFSGKMTMYLKVGTSKVLLDDMLTSVNAGLDYKYQATISLGGAVSNCVLHMPNIIINVPETNIDEAVSLSVPFKATEQNIGTGDELTITFN